MPMTNEELVNIWYHQMWNQWDKSVFPQILTEDIKFRGSLGKVIKGYDGVSSYIDYIRAAFPDFVNTIEETITESNKTFAKLRYTGTHRGTVFGIEPTGKQIEYYGAAVFTIRKQKIVEVWVLGDIYGLLAQLKD